MTLDYIVRVQRDIDRVGSRSLHLASLAAPGESLIFITLNLRHSIRRRSLKNALDGKRVEPLYVRSPIRRIVAPVIVSDSVAIVLPTAATANKAGETGLKIRKQDRSRRHGHAAKPLSAHWFARHGRAGGECRHPRQVTESEGTFGCRVCHAAPGCGGTQR